MNSFRLDFNGGKYTLIYDNGKLDALRYGEPWRNLAGDNLIFAMGAEIADHRQALGGLELPEEVSPGLFDEVVHALAASVDLMAQLPTLNGFYGLAVFTAAQDVLQHFPAKVFPEPTEPVAGNSVLVLDPGEHKLLLGLVEAGLAAHDDLPPGDNIFRRKSAEMLPVFRSIKSKLETP